MIVTIKQGRLMGIEKSSMLSSVNYFCFLGIPYAEPPVGILRFQDPKPHNGWKGVYDATKERDISVQRDTLHKTTLGSENCLFLNVYTTKKPPHNGTLYPVMVFIHGGAFNFGSCHMETYGPDFLVQREVILVAVNYRLGVFGFLNLGLPECPGNLGLKDQALAFRWIKDNIECFGGDPNNITAFGESAGSASVHYHMISPLGKGLFNKAILQSGLALNYWAYTEKCLDTAFALCDILGYKEKDRRKMLNFLLEVPTHDLFEAARQVQIKNWKMGHMDFLFVPSKEILEGCNYMAYLPYDRETLVQRCPAIPVVIGFNDNEGISMVMGTKIEKFYSMDTLRYYLTNKWQDIGLDIVINEIKRFYFNGRSPDQDTFPQIIKFLSDVGFVNDLCPVLDTLLIRSSEAAPVFLYNFKYEGSLSYRKHFLSSLCPVPFEGTSHADEITYLFVSHQLLQQGIIPEEAYSDESNMKIIDTLTTYWTNFAKTGNPSCLDVETKWTPTILEKPCYLEIENETKMKEGELFEESAKFWKNLQRHGVRKYKL